VFNSCILIESNSKTNDAAQPKSLKLCENENFTQEVTSHKNSQNLRFSERLAKSSDEKHNEKVIDDEDQIIEKVECKYCKRVYGFSRLYQIDGGYLRRHQGTMACGINRLALNGWDSEDDLDNPAEMSIVRQDHFRNSIKDRLIYPFCVSRDVFISSQNNVIMDDNDEFNHICCSSIFAYNHQYFDESDSETCMNSGDNEIAIMEDNMFTNIEMNDGPEFFMLTFRSVYTNRCTEKIVFILKISRAW